MNARKPKSEPSTGGVGVDSQAGEIDRADATCAVPPEMGNGIASRSLGVTLRALPPSLRKRARALYKSRHAGGRFDRALLEACLFEMQAAIEWMPAYQAGRAPRWRQQVEAISTVRNVLLDDLGVNEEHRGMRWPLVERAAAIMREKRRTGPANPFGRVEARRAS